MFPAKSEFFVTIKSVAQTILTVKYTSFLKEKKTSGTRILYNIKKTTVTQLTLLKSTSLFSKKRRSVSQGKMMNDLQLAMPNTNDTH